MPINLTGTIEPLPSSNPNLNLNATVEMPPATLNAFFPVTEDYAIKGTVNTGIKIQGNMYTPTTKYLALAPKLEAMNMIEANELEVTTNENDDLTRFEHVTINATAKDITANGLTLSNVNAMFTKSDDKITLTSFNAKGGAGTVTGSGVASFSDDIPMDLNFKFMNLALNSLLLGLSFDVKGDLSGTLKFSGSNTNPAMTFNSTSPTINFMGLPLSNVIANLSGNMNSIKLDRVRAELEGAEIIALGNIQTQPTLKINIAINGNSIKLERLSKEKSLSGDAAFHFTLSGTENNITGNGKLTSSAIKLHGKELEDINLPLSYSYPANTFNLGNGTAKLSGDIVSLDLSEELGGLLK